MPACLLAMGHEPNKPRRFCPCATLGCSACSFGKLPMTYRSPMFMAGLSFWTGYPGCAEVLCAILRSIIGRVRRRGTGARYMVWIKIKKRSC